MTIRVLLADDHRLLRELLAGLLQREAGLAVVGEAADGHELLRKVGELRPDVVVVDVAMPRMNGLEAAAQIAARHPSVRVLCLSAHSEPSYVRAMLRAGAAGYLNKSVVSDELVRAVRAVAAGHSYLGAEVSGAVVDWVRTGDRRTEAARGGMSSLGRRERQVLQLIAEGHSTADIAKALSISTATVDTHRRNVMRKLDLHTVVQLTRFAMREGLASP
jgi:two-component system NarL family response regulator